MHQDFRLTFNITKAYKTDDNHAYIEGIASGTEVDLTGERMSVDALKSMVASLKQGIVEFRSEHSHEWDASIGEILELSLNDDNKLIYKAKLDLGYSKAKDLVHAINKGRELGVSIGGQVLKAGMEWAEDLGKSVYTYFDILLKEISVTGTAAYPYSWLKQVTKSINKNEVTMPEESPVEAPVVEALEVETPVEEQITTDTPAENATPTVETPAEGPTVNPSPEEDETPEHAQDTATDDATPVADPVQPAPTEPTADPSEDAATAPAAPQEVETPAVATDPAAPDEGVSKPSEEELSENVTSLNKSLHAKSTEVDAVQKSLAEVTKHLEASTAKVNDLQKSLEETQTKLAEVEQENTKLAARKAFVYSPFGGIQPWSEPNESHDAKKSVMDHWLEAQGITIERNAQAA